MHELTSWLNQHQPQVLEEFLKENPHARQGLGLPPVATDPNAPWQPPKNAPWQDASGRDVRPRDPKTGAPLTHHQDGRPITALDPHPTGPKPVLSPPGSQIGAPRAELGETDPAGAPTGPKTVAKK